MKSSKDIVYLRTMTLKFRLMENKEKPKVLIDLDKYQELLEKANLNDKTIQEYKDASYNAGYKKGYCKGNDLCQLAVRQACSRLQKTLDDCFENVPGCSMLGFFRFSIYSSSVAVRQLPQGGAAALASFAV